MAMNKCMCYRFKFFDAIIMLNARMSCLLYFVVLFITYFAMKHV